MKEQLSNARARITQLELRIEGMAQRTKRMLADSHEAEQKLKDQATKLNQFEAQVQEAPALREYCTNLEKMLNELQTKYDDFVKRVNERNGKTEIRNGDQDQMLPL